MIEVLKFKKGIYQYYKENVANNKDISLDLARRKVTRNMMLARRTGGNLFQFGRLWFIVEDGTVVWMSNHCNVNPRWEINQRRFRELNMSLGIDE